MQRAITVTLIRGDVPQPGPFGIMTQVTEEDREVARTAAHAMGLDLAKFMRLAIIITARRIVDAEEALAVGGTSGVEP